MKTTIELSDAVFEKAKALAAREGTTDCALIEDGLRQVLHSRRGGPAFRLRDASVAGKGLRPEFDGASWARIREALHEDGT